MRLHPPDPTPPSPPLGPRSPRSAIDGYYKTLTAEERGRPHAEHRAFSEWTPWLAELTGRTNDVEDRADDFMGELTEVRGVPCRVVELTGDPGDAVFCSPAIFTPSRRTARTSPASCAPR